MLEIPLGWIVHPERPQGFIPCQVDYHHRYGADTPVYQTFRIRTDQLDMSGQPLSLLERLLLIFTPPRQAIHLRVYVIEEGDRWYVAAIQIDPEAHRTEPYAGHYVTLTGENSYQLGQIENLVNSGQASRLTEHPMLRLL